MYGIDISEHQGNNFKLPERNLDFVIIRAGYGRMKDKQFDNYAARAEKLGIPYGVYWYSYATDISGGAAEAACCLGVIKGHKISCGVWIDMEDADKYKRSRGALTPRICTGVCKAFCDAVSKAGYHAGIYASLSWFGPQGFIVDTYGRDKWIAAWGSNDGAEHYELSGQCSIFQYRGAPLDLDRMYVPLSWFEEDKPNAVPDIHQMAEDVILGGYGNGEARQKALGAFYDQVQAEVNRILSRSPAEPQTDLTALAWRVIHGEFGNGLARRLKLGSKYDLVQTEVNRLLNNK